MNYWDQIREIFWRLHTDDPARPVRDKWIAAYEIMKTRA